MAGDGEWQVRRHGPSRRRQWRKVHLAVDAETSDGRAVEFTSSREGDSRVLLELLAQIPPDQPIGTVTADGAYDTRRCHSAIDTRRCHSAIDTRRCHSAIDTRRCHSAIDTRRCHSAIDTRRCHSAIVERGGTAVIPIRRNGRAWKEDCPAARARNETLRATKRFGRAFWKHWTGYHARSRAEAKMRCDPRPSETASWPRTPDRQTAEIHVRVALMNRFSALGRAEIVRVA